MPRLWLSVLVVLAVLLSICPLHADGEPTARMSGTSIIVPIDEASAQVIEQKITVTLPRPGDVIWHEGVSDSWNEKRSVVRVEYVLRTAGDKTLNIQVGWPTSGYHMETRPNDPRWYLTKESTPAVKLDGKSVPVSFTRGQQLVDEENRAVIRSGMPRIESFLDTKPELRQQVKAIRGEAQSSETRNWLYAVGADKLKGWMVQKKMLPANQKWTRSVALGLLGYTRHAYADDGTPDAEFVQAALHWIDPDYKTEYLIGRVEKRWGHQEVLLNPLTGRLLDIRGRTMTGGLGFGLFRFPITLQPGQKHKLVVQYGQYLGEVGLPPEWYGMAYLMSPSKRWGGWERTTIEVRVPSEWDKIAVRPAMKKTGISNGMTIYRVEIDGRPDEDLFISTMLPRNLRK